MIIQGDCLAEMRKLPDNSVDAVVTDPPYGLSFMGKKWDYDVPSQEIWQECLRVLKPGGYLLAFAGTRTQHRMAVRIEDAGFEIRDMIAWVYGSGFPKSLNIGKAVDKLQGRGFDEVCELGRHIKECRESKNISRKEVNEKFNAVAICNHWEAQDRNNALPPTVEHWEILKTYLGCSDRFDFIVERIGKEREKIGLQEKAMSNWNMDGTTQFKDRDITKGTSEWEGWGTALKPALEPITVARKPLSEKTVAENVLRWGTGGIDIDGSRVGTEDTRQRTGGAIEGSGWGTKGGAIAGSELGRFPANLIHDGSDEVVGLFPNDSARFFYTPKASKSERNRGLEGIEPQRHADRLKDDGVGGDNPRNRTNNPKQNFHPTVKPVALMEYLVKLVSREGAVILDPFMGSGSTGIACKNLNRQFIGMELDPEYVKIAEKRIEAWKVKPEQLHI